MNDPRLEVIPLRPAVKSDESTTLDVLIRVVPTTTPKDAPGARPKLNLGLVIDRSGSMSGEKIAYARRSAAFAVEQLLPTDRVSVTIYDDQVETIVPSTLAADKRAIIGKIETILARNSTDLHSGWHHGAEQVRANLLKDGLNRVLLLSDGLANHGLTDPERIAANVKKALGTGISTTTLGFGRDYNEDLMTKMAVVGDGNYYVIDSPTQLVDIFQTELEGLAATVGTKVSLGVDPRSDGRIAEVLNDLEKLPTGRLMLPNLVLGMPVPVVVRLSIPPQGGPTADVAEIRLAWDEPKGSGRRVLRQTLTLSTMSVAAWSELAEDAAVRQEVDMLMAARAAQEAVRAIERGDWVMAEHYGEVTQAMHLAAGASPEKMAKVKAMLEAIGDKDSVIARKRALWRGYEARRGK